LILGHFAWGGPGPPGGVRPPPVWARQDPNGPLAGGPPWERPPRLPASRVHFWHPPPPLPGSLSQLHRARLWGGFQVVWRLFCWPSCHLVPLSSSSLARAPAARHSHARASHFVPVFLSFFGLAWWPGWLGGLGGVGRFLVSVSVLIACKTRLLALLCRQVTRSALPGFRKCLVKTLFNRL